MGTKEHPDIFDCYGAAAPDEPLFVLKASDLSAPLAVRFWAELYRARKRDADQWTEDSILRYSTALDTSEAMRAWRMARSLGDELADRGRTSVPVDRAADTDVRELREKHD
jgi:hypothetical protein